MDSDSRVDGIRPRRERAARESEDASHTRWTPSGRGTGRLGTLLAAATGFVLAAGPALAHGGHSGHAGGGGTNEELALALVGGSVLILGTSVYLDRAGELDGPWKDLGVLLGVVGVLAGLTLVLV